MVNCVAEASVLDQTLCETGMKQCLENLGYKMVDNRRVKAGELREMARYCWPKRSYRFDKLGPSERFLGIIGKESLWKELKDSDVALWVFRRSMSHVRG